MRIKILLLGLVVFLIVMLIPGSALGWPPYGYGMQPPWMVQATPSLRLERQADTDAYHLVIHLSGITASAVNVRLEGMRWLHISIDQSNEASYSNDGRDGYGYYRGYSYNSSNQSRRISLPRDADGTAMQREDATNSIHIRIPRLR